MEPLLFACILILFLIAQYFVIKYAIKQAIKESVKMISRKSQKKPLTVRIKETEKVFVEKESNPAENNA